MAQEKQTHRVNGRILTVLDCQLGNHSGAFAITRTTLGWACDAHLPASPAVPVEQYTKGAEGPISHRKEAKP